MYPSATPPREVKIGDAAAFAGTTPRAIRHYHQIGEDALWLLRGPNAVHGTHGTAP
jgi:hypothetical protein